jgi:Fe-S-cluster containining protein
LSSGIPCTSHKCVKCCIETRMPLSRSDVDRISKQGYRFKDFVVKWGKERRLRNINGRCVFLREDGCVIYPFRPEGCRLYPLVFNENTRKVGVHKLCPYGHEFEVGRDDVENLTVLFNKLSERRNQSH